MHLYRISIIYSEFGKIGKSNLKMFYIPIVSATVFEIVLILFWEH